VAAQQLRGNDARLQRLTQAMLTEAWQEVYQSFDIEEFIDNLVSNKSIKKALEKLDVDED
jgi:acyl carrier protein phosphodiesterase